MDRAQTPHSFVSASTFVSFDGPDRSPAPTPSPRMPAAADELLGAAGALAPHQLRARTLSNVSCVSNATFWSAVASASPEPQPQPSYQPPPPPQHMPHQPPSPSQHQPPSPSPRQPPHRSHVRKADSGVALDGGRERPRRPSGPADPGRARPPQPQPPQQQQQQPPQQPSQPPSRQPSLARSARRTSSHAKPPHPRRHPSESWDTAEAITAARHAKRREIALSLGHAPNRSPPYAAVADFTRSADSLAPTRAPSARRRLSSPPASAPPTAPSWSPLRPATSTTTATAAAPPSPTLPTAVRSKPYADASAKRPAAAWDWLRRRARSLLRCSSSSSSTDFWEDGHDDWGSVRRYRLVVPPDRVAPRRVRVSSSAASASSSSLSRAGGVGLGIRSL